ADEYRRAALDCWRRHGEAEEPHLKSDPSFPDSGFFIRAGMTLDHMGDYPQALAMYQGLLERRRRLAHDHPASASLQSALWKVQRCIGDDLMHLERFEEACQ